MLGITTLTLSLGKKDDHPDPFTLRRCKCVIHFTLRERKIRLRPDPPNINLSFLIPKIDVKEREEAGLASTEISFLPHDQRRPYPNTLVTGDAKKRWFRNATLLGNFFRCFKSFSVTHDLIRNRVQGQPLAMVMSNVKFGNFARHSHNVSVRKKARNQI